MNKALCALALLVTVPAWAAWEEIGTDASEYVHHVDLDTFRHAGTTYRVWTMTDYRSLTRPGIHSKKVHWEFDCGENRARRLQSHYYKGRMGEGQLLNSNTPTASWEQVLPDSSAAPLFDVICRPVD